MEPRKTAPTQKIIVANGNPQVLSVKNDLNQFTTYPLILQPLNASVTWYSMKNCR